MNTVTRTAKTNSLIFPSTPDIWKPKLENLKGMESLALLSETSQKNGFPYNLMCFNQLLALNRLSAVFDAYYLVIYSTVLLVISKGTTT